MESAAASKPLLDALRGTKQPSPPIWIMRQAGRYLPEYRTLRKKVDFLTLCRTPDLACEVTLQPLRRFAMDGAILFSDILIPLVPMGMKLRFGPDQGPVMDNPLRTRQDIQGLKEVEDSTFVGETLELIRKDLPPGVTLLGFAGAPFTLASYMVEGKGTKNFLKIKSLMYNDPTAYEMLMNKLVAVTIGYLEMQAKHGAEALQLFDSWAGQLTPEDYQKYAHPHSEKIIAHMQKLGVPVIHFAKNGGGLLPPLSKGTASGLGIGWECSLQEAVRALPPNKCLQGNLDPAVLLAPSEILEEKTRSILRIMSKASQSHIFNLGHGIYPDTPVDSVSRLLDIVKNPEAVFV